MYIRCIKYEHFCLVLLLKSMVVWVDKFWGWVTVASELSRLTSCPLHCGGSVVPWFGLGIAIGFLPGTPPFWTLCCVVDFPS